MDKNYNQRVGKWGEELASLFLQKKGYQPIDKNFHCRGGEVDLIMTKDEYLVFVEVKTRTKPTAGGSEESLNFRKMKRVKKAIDYYLVGHDTPLSPRFDVVIVEIFGSHPQFIHYEAVEI
jgi:putative endonuclease